MEWTEDKVNTLRTDWAAGFSAGQIARKFGCTRNAVIGKMTRLKLPPRNNAGRSQSAANAVNQKTGVLRPFSFLPPKSERKSSSPPEPYVFRETIVTAEHERVSFEALEPFDKRCRYAHGDTLPFTFCGAKTVPTTSYCLEHLKVCAPALAAKHQPADAVSKELEPVA